MFLLKSIYIASKILEKHIQNSQISNCTMVLTHKNLYGIVWYGMVWYCIVWYSLVWYSMVWYGMIV